jgi:hypothetical protein
MKIKLFDDFVFTSVGFDLIWDFKKKLKGRFFYDNGGGPVYADADGNTYTVPDEPIADFKAAVEESLKQGRDLFPERYKDYKFEYEQGVEY